jgi:O-antigen/teichoic acid export membrane protein
MPTQTKKISLDTAAILIGKFVGLLLGIVRLNFIATYLSIVSFGILNFAFYFCSLFQTLFDFGMSQLLIREVARDLSKSRELVGRIIFLKVIVVILATAIVEIVSLMFYHDNQTMWAITLTTIVFAINGLSMVFLAAFQAHRRMRLVSLFNIFNDLILSLLIIALIGKYSSINMVLFLSVGVAGLNLIVIYFMYVLYIGKPHLAVDLTLWRLFLKESAPIALSSIGTSMYIFTGPTVLKYTRGDIETALYTAGYKLISILSLIPLTVMQVVYPVFSDFFVRAKEKLSKSLYDSIRIVSLISIPIVIGTVLLAQKVFMILYPPAYSAGVIVLQLAIIGSVWSYMNAILQTFLLSIGKQSFLMVFLLSIGLVISIISIIVIPPLGYIAIPVILCAAEIIVFWGYRWYLHTIGYTENVIKYFVKPLIASFIMGIIIWFSLSMHIVIVIALGASTYLIALYFLRGYGEQEREIMRSFFARVFNNYESGKTNG